ncbi:MAG: NAD(P)-dependent oxidoreductase [Candidatus Accumulibacter phosphatis]|nr:NAD(P)-dependent oxidoreductase [Candidatus Accumulibacter phosphatis]
MAGASIFITGGTGFFGHWLLETLAWANARLQVGICATVLSRDPTTCARRISCLAANPSITVVPGDVRSFDFPTSRFTHVVHAAFDSARPIDDPLAAFDTLATGTRRVLEFAATQPLKNMLFVSSGAVYGPQPPGMACMAEDYCGGPDPASASSVYGEGKRAAELLCAMAAADGLPVTIARCFAFIGPGLPLDAHFAAGNFLRDAAAGKEIVIKGDGRPLRSYLYAADLAIWLWTVLLKGSAGRAYNVGSKEPVSICELARAIAARAPTRPAVRILGTPGRAPAERYVPCVRRATEELGLSRTVVLEDAIDRSFRWLHRSA